MDKNQVKKYKDRAGVQHAHISALSIEMVNLQIDHAAVHDDHELVKRKLAEADSTMLEIEDEVASARLALQICSGDEIDMTSDSNKRLLAKMVVDRLIH